MLFVYSHNCFVVLMLYFAVVVSTRVCSLAWWLFAFMHGLVCVLRLGVWMSVKTSLKHDTDFNNAGNNLTIYHVKGFNDIWI